ncbi:histidine phosphatase family protein [Actinomadura sp. DC4]|uniref:histidine phosphatase family protein n=1 Tax=Actinomadura sp. DC4 TaxID=3055069 RepID=UPI0025B2723B|nr:histidine phosphatase family protein [Actinomadura sp. DC4]MDN3355265.1 histidine phosphatase family protein [Actinomadura sp. DC4]
MATLLLVRHGLTEMTGPVLAGWTPGVHLNERGRAQAAELAARLAPIPLDLIVASPLDRCQETAQAVVAGRDGLQLRTDDRFGEVRYGEWTGRPLEELAKEELWKVVQAHPSAVRFPGGEAMADAQHRAVTAVREWNDGLKPDATFLVCSHGDIIKAIIADALGLHLDQFQRIQADPASLTVIRYTETRPFVVRLNDNGGKVDDLLAKSGQDSDAPVGGGA